MIFAEDFNTMSPSKGYFSRFHIFQAKREEEIEERRNIDFLVSEKFRIEAQIERYSKRDDAEAKCAVINFNKALKKIQDEIKRRFTEEDVKKATSRYFARKYAKQVKENNEKVKANLASSNEGR